MGKIIAIDGPSNAGKTTLCELLVNNISNSILIEESGRRVVHPKPSTNYEEEIRNQIFYFEQDRIRLEEAIEYSKQGKIVILDRSPISIVANAYSFEKTGKCECYTNSRQLYYELEELIKQINVNVYLFADYEILMYRNSIQMLSKEWMNQSVINNQISFYLNNQYESAKLLKYDSGILSINEIAETIKEELDHD